jgi:Ran GTPase-activating protein (RanGAP) involved in mRNA processing and transport
LADNYLDDYAFDLLSKGLAECHLTSLIMRKNEVKYPEELVNHLSKSSLEFLDFHSNKLNHDGAEYLAQALTNCHTLRSLDLSNNPIGSKGLAHLTKAIPTTSLTSLNLHSCGIGNVGCALLTSVLQLSSSCLTSLDLGANDLVGGTSELTEFFKVLQSSTSLTLLDLSEIAKLTDSADDIAAVLASSSSALTDLNLAGTNFKQTALSSLFKGLSASPSLRVLNLNLQSRLTDSNVSQLFRSLPASLTSLDFACDDEVSGETSQQICRFLCSEKVSEFHLLTPEVVYNQQALSKFDDFAKRNPSARLDWKRSGRWYSSSNG